MASEIMVAIGLGVDDSKGAAVAMNASVIVGVTYLKKKFFYITSNP